MVKAVEQRQELMDTLFPEGIPRLWVPLLTFYNEEAEVDPVHTQAHHDFLSPQVNSFLTPGSTGDGWELTGTEVETLLRMELEVAKRRRQSVMVGVLKTGSGEAAEQVASLAERYGGRATKQAKGIDRESAAALLRRRITGFTVTPPKGRELKQEEIYDELAEVLDFGLPTALYQLPQITENSMEPETVAALAERYPGFYLLKDTSGEDTVASAGLDYGGVYFVRGAEGGYADHLKSAGGAYDGYLLSTANCFAKELREIIWMCDNNRHGEARALARRVSAVVDHAFGLVEGLGYANSFSNANRAIDHIFAYGNESKILPPPMTHSGRRLPEEVILAVRDALAAEGFNTEIGYVNPAIHGYDEFD
ncbi:MAG: dihydrodipicolinate synthase family protein [Alkalispirochaetaceae bacterium]